MNEKKLKVMKRQILIFLCIWGVMRVFAQEGSSLFSVIGGYENFPDMVNKNGYNVGVEFKHYVHKSIFFVAHFHAGINGKDFVVQFEQDGGSDHSLQNKVRDYMMGLGLGADVLQKERHRVYVQGTVGLGNSMKRQELPDIMNAPATLMREENVTRYALAASVGYDYRLNRWLSVGVNYTGYYIGYDYKHTANMKLGVWF